MKIYYTLLLSIFFFHSPLSLADINKDLRTAAKENNVAAIQSLLKNNAEKDATSKKGRTALILASKNNSYEAANELIKAGANINAQDKKGRTALYFAAKEDSIKVAQLLVAHNADTSLRDTNGYNAYEIAQDKDSYTIEKLILHSRRSVAIIIDNTGRNISSAQFKDAAMATLNKRGWQVVNPTSNQVEGILEKSDFTFKCRIIHDKDEIIIRYQKGYGVTKLNYLINLENDIRISLN